MTAVRDTDRPAEQRPLAGIALRLLTALLLAIMVALIIAVIVVLVATVGRQVFDMYNTVPSF